MSFVNPGERQELLISACDRFGNRISSKPRASGGGGGGGRPGEQGGGYGGQRTDRLCGEAALVDDDGGVDVTGSPASIFVSPAAPSPEHCTLTGDCLRLGTAIAGERQDGP